MNRRATLATLRGQKQPKAIATHTSQTAHLSMLSGLMPYMGPWTFEQAAHLLRRTTFGPTAAQIQAAVANGMEATIAELLADRPQPDPPINHNYQPMTETEIDVPIGTTWVNSPRGTTNAGNQMREESLKGWTVDLWLDSTISIREKMTLFWHNHFVVQSQIVEDLRLVYHYIALLREHALGNFRELTKAITINPAMLIYLNGNLNTKEDPNENYARELLELFTVGKGQLAGEGDYTTFTEQDVLAIARILTGWREKVTTISPTEETITAVFEAERHDTGTKELSARFENAVIENAGEEEYANLIDVIFQSPAAAQYICRKLYLWFVYYKIDEETEAEVIEPMAQLLRDNDFDIKPVLEVLLSSDHFYNILSIGPMIKNPIDFTLSTIKPFAVQFPESLQERYPLLVQIFDTLRPMQMEMYNPPEVAGWKAWYQAPQYYRTWINSISLPARQGLTVAMTSSGLTSGLLSAKIDVLAFVETLDDTLDPNLLIENMAKILFPRPIFPSQIAQLKELLIPGLPDFEWAVEYGQFLANPENSDLAVAIENKLRTLLQAMLGMAEFYLS